MTIDESLPLLGVNKRETLQRFSGKEELMQYFILKFPEDKTLPSLKDSIKSGNWERILNDAHTLKGLSGNLGFTELFTVSSALVAAIRAKDYEKAEALKQQVLDCADKDVDIIKKIDNN